MLAIGWVLDCSPGADWMRSPGPAHPWQRLQTPPNGCGVSDDGRIHSAGSDEQSPRSDGNADLLARAVPDVCAPVVPNLGAVFIGLTRAQIAPDEVLDPLIEDEIDLDKAWNVVVWNDPVNLMGYVVYVFRKLFGYSEEKATELMLQVHHDGRAIVSTGPREKAEFDCFRLHRYGLWATLERA